MTRDAVRALGRSLEDDGGGAMLASAPAQVVRSSYDDYVASIQHARLRGFILSRETRPWSVSRCALGRSVLEYGVEGAPYVATGVAAPGSTSFYLSGSPGSPRFANGYELGDSSLVRWREGEDVALSVPRPGDWYALTVPSGVLADLTATLEGEGPPPGGKTVRLELTAERLASLRALSASAVEAAGSAAPEGRGLEAGAALEAALLAEVVRASRPVPRPSRGSRPRISRRRVLARLDAMLAERTSEPLYVADLCAATGLPERTLRHIVVEQYGTSPIRLLRSRRLGRLREALLSEPPGAGTLREIAARHGFWHLSQLAVDYRRLFGELPSQTLRAARQRSRGRTPLA